MNKQAFMNSYATLSSMSYVEVVKTNKDLISILSLQRVSNPLGFRIN